ncbi:MAG TPA: hypothetical protein PKK99_01590 [Bacteroidia bacterium]|nr:hypothetical protein [Bacteroidia bacterium]HNP97714.1 hypothetical protein [Bacteroidia bacterium]
MKQYIVTSKLPEEFTQEFLSLIPLQRAAVNRLMNKGIILTYAVAGDRSRLWITLEAESEADVIHNLSELPLIRFMRPEITELLFFHNLSFMLPHPSLN